MIMIKENGKATISFEAEGGEHLRLIQNSLILAMNEIAHAELASEREYKNAIWIISTLLKECLFDDSQTSIAIGGKAYKDEEESK